MFKMLKPTFLIVPVAWLTLLLWTGFDAARPLLAGIGLTPRLSWAVLGVQIVVTLFFVTPLWRKAWKKWPVLGRLVYPDLNGDWDVELSTNWPRIDQILKAAKGDAPPIDMRTGPETDLPPLGTMNMRARIIQSWLSMKMELWNPRGEGPILESQTFMIMPFRGEDGRHGMTYIYEQENATDVVSDDTKFRGAAWIVQDRDDPDLLCGRMWSDRMWRRGMNTAADLRFVRRKDG